MNAELKTLFDEIESRGMTIKSFAAKTGIPADRVYGWKNGRGVPKTKDSERIQIFLEQQSKVEEPAKPYNEKLTAMEATVAVLMQRVAKLMAAQFGVAEIVELKQIEKDAQALRQMQEV